MFIWVDWDILKILYNVFEIVKNYLGWEWSNADAGAVLPSAFNIYKVRARVNGGFRIACGRRKKDVRALSIEITAQPRPWPGRCRRRRRRITTCAPRLHPDPHGRTVTSAISPPGGHERIKDRFKE